MNGPGQQARAPGPGKPPLEGNDNFPHRRISMHLIQTAESLRKDGGRRQSLAASALMAGVAQTLAGWLPVTLQIAAVM